jgi:hypothetical protein
MLVIPTFEKQKQDARRFEVSLGYKVSSRPVNFSNPLPKKCTLILLVSVTVAVVMSSLG